MKYVAGLAVGGYLMMIVAVIYGWINNILLLVALDASPVTGEFVLRVVGIVVPPLGAVMGYV